MPFPDQKIGDQVFTFLSGPPEIPRTDLEVIARPGAPGVGIYRTGVRGRPITLRSEVDLADKATALARWGEYLAMVGQDPVDVVWQGQGLEALRSCRCLVLDVQLADVPRSLETAVGGVNVDDGQPCVWLTCDWTLITLDLNASS